MESERSNCCTGRKVTGQLAGLLGLLLGVVLCAFIIYVGVESDQLSRTGIIKIALILMFGKVFSSTQVAFLVIFNSKTMFYLLIVQ